MKKLRVLVLLHEGLVPPEDLEAVSEQELFDVKTEYDVVAALDNMGHEVKTLGVSDEVRPIRRAVERWRPDIVFNLLEEFQGKAAYDHHVVAYLELLGIPYTGCNPRGLVIARDKALTKKLLSYHRIPTPKFGVSRMGRKVRRPRALEYPLIVKSLIEESSLGISKASVVHDDEHLAERVRMIHERIKTDAIVERFIEGRELYVGVLGNERLTVLPAQELVIADRDPKQPLVATESVKHHPDYQKRHGVEIVGLQASDELQRKLDRMAKRVYRVLGLDGYARIDLRLDAQGRPFVLEANPNAEIARYEEIASAAEAVGISYEELLQRVINFGLRR